MKSIARLSAPEYLPSDEDILYSQLLTKDTTETNFTVGRDSQGEVLDLWVYDVGGRRPARKTWVHAQERTDLVIFTVDIGCYDQQFSGDSSVNRMQEAIALWDSVVHSRWFIKSEFLLCFTKQAKFAAKLKDSPLATHFPQLCF